MKTKGKIRKKFFAYFAICTLVPVLIFTILASIYIATNEVKSQRSYMTSRLENTVDELDTLIQQVSQIGHTVSEDDFLRQCLAEKYDSQAERYDINLKANNALLYVSKYFNKNLHVYIIGENKGLYKSGYLSFKNEDFTSQNWYQSLAESDQEIWFDIHQDSFVANSVNEGYLSLGIPIHDSKSKEFLGAVLVDLQVNEIFKNILDRQEEKIYLFHPNTSMSIDNGQVELYKGGTLIDLGKTMTLYQTSDKKPAYIEKTVDAISYWKDDFAGKDTLETSGYYMSYECLTVNDWILVSVMENGQLYTNIYSIIWYALVSLAVLFMLIFFVSYRLSQSVSNPIEILKEKVEEVQTGNFDVSIQKVSDDEIGELGEQFNQMVIDIKSLMERIREEQKKLRGYELMLLQAQINPHFLYNTLDSLCWLIRMKQSEDALKMTIALTRFFVTGLNGGQDVISLGKEMENVKSYLTIQQLRYKSKLNYCIYCEETIEAFEIPKLILQPFVENALYHGIKGKENGGIIEVRGYRDGERIHLTVVDDGVGMDPEQLEALRADEEHMETEKTDSYGIKNVRERLKLFYGENCTMELQSSLGVGTMITISIRGESKCIN